MAFAFAGRWPSSFPQLVPAPRAGGKAHGPSQRAPATPVGNTRVWPETNTSGTPRACTDRLHRSASGPALGLGEGLAGPRGAGELASRSPPPAAAPQPRAGPPPARGQHGAPVREGGSRCPSPWSRGAAPAAALPLKVGWGPRPSGLRGGLGLPAAGQAGGEAGRGLRAGGSGLRRCRHPAAVAPWAASSGRGCWCVRGRPSCL